MLLRRPKTPIITHCFSNEFPMISAHFHGIRPIRFPLNCIEDHLGLHWNTLQIILKCLARLGSAWLGSVRFGLARLGSARLGSAWLGVARLGSVWFGLVWFGSVRLGSAWFGLIRFGSARFGSAWFGSVRFGSVRFGSAWLCLAWLGSAWLGFAWLGSARLGSAPKAPHALEHRPFRKFSRHPCALKFIPSHCSQG